MFKIRQQLTKIKSINSMVDLQLMRLVFLVYFWYCEDLLIIPDLKYLYCDMNYLFNPYMSKKSIFRIFKPPPLECQRPTYKICVKPHSSMTS